MLGIVACTHIYATIKGYVHAFYHSTAAVLMGVDAAVLHHSNSVFVVLVVVLSFEN